MRAEGPEGHADAGELLAVVDGELSPERAAELQDHLAACVLCADRLREVREDAAALGEALRATDLPPPRGSAGAIRRAAAGWTLARAAPVAAVLVLVFAGGALALMPGSPLRAWLSELRGHRAHDFSTDAAPAAAVTQFSVTSPDSVDVLIGLPSDSLAVELVRSEGRRLMVATGDNGSLAGVELGDGRLSVEPGSVRLLRIVFPRNARVRVLAEGRNLLASPRPAAPGGGSPGDSVSLVRLGPVGGGER